MIGFTIVSIILFCIGIAVFGIQTDKIAHQLERLADIWESQVSEEDEMKISDEMVASLEERAKRGFSEVPPTEFETYKKGLKDGETLTAQYVLGEVEEED